MPFRGVSAKMCPGRIGAPGQNWSNRNNNDTHTHTTDMLNAWCDRFDARLTAIPSKKQLRTALFRHFDVFVNCKVVVDMYYMIYEYRSTTTMYGSVSSTHSIHEGESKNNIHLKACRGFRGSRCDST